MSYTMTDYTCNEYRQEMILMGLRRQLSRDTLSEAEQRRIEDEIRQLEKQMEMD